MSATIIPFPAPAMKIPRRPRPDGAELELLRFVAEGFTCEEIAARFGLEPEAVDRLLEETLAKLHARSAAQAVAMCLRRGLLR